MTLPEWKDRKIERENTFNVLNNKDGTITLIPVTGEIYEAGTPLNALNLNKINAQLEDIDTEKVDKVVKIINNEINQGIQINNSIDNVSYENLDIETTGYSMLINTNTTGQCLRLTKSKIYSEETDGIEINTTNTNIEDTLKSIIITDNFIKTGLTGASSQSGFGIGIARGQDIIVSSNIVSESRSEALHVEGASRNIIVANNLFLNCNKDGARILYSEKDGIKGEPILLTNNVFRKKNLSKTDTGIKLVTDTNGQAKIKINSNKIIGFDIGINPYNAPIDVSGSLIENCNIALKPLNDVYGIIELKNTPCFIVLEGSNAVNKSNMLNVDGFYTEDIMDKDSIIKITNNYSGSYDIKYMQFYTNIASASASANFTVNFIKVPYYFDGIIDFRLSNGANTLACKFKANIKDGVLTSTREIRLSNGNLSGGELLIENGYLSFKGFSTTSFSNITAKVIMNGSAVYNYNNFS